AFAHRRRALLPQSHARGAELSRCRSARRRATSVGDIGAQCAAVGQARLVLSACAARDLCRALLPHWRARVFANHRSHELTMTESIRAENGYFEGFGGAFIPEVLYATFEQLKQAFATARSDPSFWNEYAELMSTYSCRPTPLTFAENL